MGNTGGTFEYHSASPSKKEAEPEEKKLPYLDRKNNQLLKNMKIKNKREAWKITDEGRN